MDLQHVIFISVDQLRRRDLFFQIEFVPQVLRPCFFFLGGVGGGGVGYQLAWTAHARGVSKFGSFQTCFCFSASLSGDHGNIDIDKGC